jgi:dihydrolipoamide dehydrogenase
LSKTERPDYYEAVVIGSGPGGYHAAIRLGQLQKKVLLVEKGKLGGVCLNIGCIPSKALITAGKLVKRTREAKRMGISAEVGVDLPKLQEWKQGVVNQLTSGVGALCRANGVQIFKGTAKFVSPNELQLTSVDDFKSRVVRFENSVIATGTEPSELPNVKFDGRRIISSTEALEIKQPPKSILIVGGGVIGLEIGMMYSNLFGTNLTIVEILPQILPAVDPDIAAVVGRALQRVGAKVHVRSKIKNVSAHGDSVRATYDDEQGTEQTGEADYVLLSVGRRPNVRGLGLEEIGIKLSERGFIQVDREMRTNVENVFAIGDVAGPPLLAHKAMKEGIVAAEVIAGLKSAADWSAMPNAIFTDPEIAATGISETDARAQGIDITVGKFPFIASGRALTSSTTEGFTKVIAEKETGRILGYSVVGEESTELISEATLAIEMGATLEDISLTVHPHPTLSETVMEAAENALGKAIHIQNRPRQTESD